jgi:hypothetical protein
MSMRRISVIGVMLTCGCVMWQREPGFYATELEELFEQPNQTIAACYDRVLEQDPKAAGTVTVNFEVERKTGRLHDVAVVQAQSDAPEPLEACVIETISTLTLDPPDANTAEATFAWQFVRGSQKRPPPDPFAGVQDTVLGCYTTHLREVDRTATGDVTIDYAFNRESGAVETIDVIADATTAPQPVVACIRDALAAARIAPDKLDDRNTAGRRTFTLRYTPDSAPDAG